MTDFVLQTTEWYRQNARKLPWRDTANPYFIWLSEVILQQTRVDQGMNYYLRFTEAFPTVSDLANADEETVLKLWQGLGYYSRARNLRTTAGEIDKRFGGRLPASYEELLSLKGIGPYTAAAVASFGFGLKHAVVDGNVYRVLSRWFGIDEPIDSTSGKKTFQALADELIPESDPATYNQAVMELGAVICTPANPRCDICPAFEGCASGRSGLWRSRPVKAKKTAVRDRWLHYFHIEKDGMIAVKKRTGKDIWLNLYEFPLIETDNPELTSEDLEKAGLSHRLIVEKLRTRHILSHQRIHAVFYSVSGSGQLQFPDIQWVSTEGFHNLPVHRLIEKYAEESGM
jgi:A/G-specific adenine glycosylase